MGDPDLKPDPKDYEHDESAAEPLNRAGLWTEDKFIHRCVGI